jgi:hypothetical protein
MPQSKPCCWQVFGVHPGTPQTLGWLAPQILQVPQVPQWITPPHPSLAVPQSKPWSAQVFGEQTQW